MIYIVANGLVSAGSEVLFGINNKVPGDHIANVRKVIASPMPLIPWRRELIVGALNDWQVGRTDEFGHYQPPKPITAFRCAWPSVPELANGGAGAKAFLFWSRAPFAERAPDGSVLIRDARYYDPRARNRFTVALPDVRCEPAPLP